MGTRAKELIYFFVSFVLSIFFVLSIIACWLKCKFHLWRQTEYVNSDKSPSLSEDQTFGNLINIQEYAENQIGTTIVYGHSPHSSVKLPYVYCTDGHTATIIPIEPLLAARHGERKSISMRSSSLMSSKRDLSICSSRTQNICDSEAATNQQTDRTTATASNTTGSNTVVTELESTISSEAIVQQLQNEDFSGVQVAYTNNNVDGESNESNKKFNIECVREHDSNPKSVSTTSHVTPIDRRRSWHQVMSSKT